MIDEKFRERLLTIAKVALFSITFSVCYIYAPILNPGGLVVLGMLVPPNWVIGFWGSLTTMVLYLMPSNKWYFRGFRRVFFVLFGFFLGLFQSQFGEFYEAASTLYRAFN